MGKGVFFVFHGLFITACILLWHACKPSHKPDSTATPLSHAHFRQFSDAEIILPEWKKDNLLVVHLAADPVFLHPASITNINATIISRLINGFLVTYDPIAQQLVPGLCRSLPTLDANQLAFTYELRDNLFWDDGSPVTVEDVVFTFKAYTCPLTNNPALKPHLSNLWDIVPDPQHPRRFTIRMKNPSVQSETFLTDLPIISRRQYDPDNLLAAYRLSQFTNPAFGAHQHKLLVQWAKRFNDVRLGTDPERMHGLGPYRIARWEPGQFLLLERKTNHWTFALDSCPIPLTANPQKILFRILRDETAIKLELLAQNIDVSSALPADILEQLLTDSSFLRNYNAAYLENYACNVIHLNTRPDGKNRQRIFDDVRVRRAMAHLIPVDQMMRVLPKNRAVRWATFLPPFHKLVDTSLQLIEFNPGRANRLLDSAGWTAIDNDGVRYKIIDGKKVRLEVELTQPIHGTASTHVANMIRESAALAGIRVHPRPLEMGAVLSNAAAHDFDMLILTLSLSPLTKDFSQIWHTRSWLSNGSNYSGFGNAASDALLDSLKVALNDSIYGALLRRLQRMVYDEQPVIFSYATHRKVVMHRRWGNQIMTRDAPGFLPNYLRLLPSATQATTVSVN